jgi:EAL domain-containing protein (putative c-di-GMP-specific phosphodiesterase class I)
MSRDETDVKAALEQLATNLQHSQAESDGILFKSCTVFLNQFNSHSPEFFRKVIVEMKQRADTPPVFISNAQAILDFESHILTQIQKSLDIASFIEQEKIEIVLQPITTLKANKKPLAYEVLGRVQTDKGQLSAGIFIDRLIELGLTTTFDLLILKKVCDNAHLLREITDTIFINVSPVSLNEEQYIKQLLFALKNELKALNVVVELTEQTLLTEIDRVKKLSAENGLIFAIDDFGTGYSSLLTVIDLATSNAVRYLKIDGSLTKGIIENPSISLIFDVISNLSKSLNLYSIAEFIENADLAQALNAQNITYGQGYYLGRPNSIEYWLVESLSQIETT